MQPIAQDVAAFLRRADDTAIVDLAAEHLPVVTAMTKAYVRGNGFDPATGEPADDLALVIVASTARLSANPNMTREQSIDDYSAKQAIFNGWTLPELAVLHSYRRRAA